MSVPDKTLIVRNSIIERIEAWKKGFVKRRGKDSRIASRGLGDLESTSV